jgi:hypothetical protein
MDEEIRASGAADLVCDDAAGLLHALTSGAHWTLQEQDWAC